MIDKLIEMDGNALIWIQEHLRNDILDPIMKGITHLGDAGLFWIALCVLMLIIPRTRMKGLVCSCSLAATFLLNNILLKNLIARTRPYEVVEGLTRIIEAQSDYSFPSGHSGASFAVAVAMFLELPKKIGVPALILAFLIALSRLYVGVHYPSDVIVGMAIGSLFAVIFHKVFHSMANKNSISERQQDE